MGPPGRLERTFRSVATHGTPEPARAATNVADVDVADRIARAGETLTPAERRVAEVVLARPQLVAFGTVAELAEAAGSGAATVVRLAAKIAYDGFSALQRAVQLELAGQLRPAAERIREPSADDLVGRHLHLEVANVTTTLGGLAPAALDDVCKPFGLQYFLIKLHIGQKIQYDLVT